MVVCTRLKPIGRMSDSANRLPGPDGCTTVPSGRVTGRAEISGGAPSGPPQPATIAAIAHTARYCRSEEHTSELQSLMRISYAVFCLKKKKTSYYEQEHTHNHIS